MHRPNETLIDKKFHPIVSKLIPDKRTNTYNFQEFRKVYGPILNKDKREPSLNQKNSTQSVLSSSTEINMIRMEMPKLGSEHAILNLNQSKPLLRKSVSGEKHVRKLVKPTQDIKILFEEAHDTSRKLKQIRQILQEKQLMSAKLDLANRIKQNNIQTNLKNNFKNERIKRNYLFTLTLMQKKLREVEKKYFGDHEIETIFDNSSIKQKDSLQEIPEEDLEALREQSTIKADRYIEKSIVNKAENQIDKECIKRSPTTKSFLDNDKKDVKMTATQQKTLSRKKFEFLVNSFKDRKQKTKTVKEKIINLKRGTSHADRSELHKSLKYKLRLAQKPHTGEPQIRRDSGKKSSEKTMFFNRILDINPEPPKSMQKEKTMKLLHEKNRPEGSGKKGNKIKNKTPDKERKPSFQIASTRSPKTTRQKMKVTEESASIRIPKRNRNSSRASNN